jgi:hypothetical protein
VKVLVASKRLMSQGRMYRSNEVLRRNYSLPLFCGGIWATMQKHYGFVCDKVYRYDMDEILDEFMLGDFM